MVNKQGQRSMKTAIKMFSGFGSIRKRRSKFAKIRVFKVDNFNLPLFLVPKLRSVAQNEWKKHPDIFFYPWFKNKRVWAEKVRKKPKSIKIINSKNSDFCKFWPSLPNWTKSWEHFYGRFHRPLALLIHHWTLLSSAVQVKSLYAIR